MTNEDVDSAVFDFIVANHAAPPEIPALEKDGEILIYRGFGESSPPATTDYIVFTRTSDLQLELTMEDFQSNFETREDGTLTIAPLRQFYYQVDSYGKHSADRGIRLRSIFNSGKGPEFFRKYHNKYGGIGVIRAGGGDNITEVDGTGKYASRWSFDLSLAARITTVVSQDWLDKLSIKIKGVKPNAY